MMPQTGYLDTPFHHAHFHHRLQSQNQQFRRLNGYQTIPQPHKETHDFHIFCIKCFKNTWFGKTAFTGYLIIAWIIGLWGCSVATSAHPRILFIIGVYLLSQFFGLIAAISKTKMMFIPYVIVLLLFIAMSITSTIHFTLRIFSSPYDRESKIHGFIQGFNHMMAHFKRDSAAAISFSYMIYNFICLASVLHLCASFDESKAIASIRRREQRIRHALLYERLIAINHREANNDIVIDNVDSPPKYSTLNRKTAILESPPPNYSNVPTSLRFSESEGDNSSVSSTKINRPLFDV